MKAIASQPVVVRSTPPAAANYSDYREVLRFDFFFSCAYCTVSEAEAWGIGFQIDHYIPQAHGGGDEYGNLMWSCQVCNRQKSAVWPTQQQQEAGYRFIRPDIDDPEDHFSLAGSMIFSKTTPGEFTLEVLLLNRPALRAIRELRRKITSSLEAVSGGLQQLRKLKVDHLKPEARARFLEAKDAAFKQLLSLNESDEAHLIVRVLNHSPMLDPDPEVRERNKRRRAYLKSLGSRTDLKFEPTV